MGITKDELALLPKCPMDNESRQNVVDYVSMVMDGTSRAKALKEVYPLRYERAVQRAGGNKRVIDANIQKEYNQIERSKYAQQMFVAAEKHWWMKFLDKKQKIYEKAYGIAMDDNQDTKDQLTAMRMLMQFLPTAPREDKLEITHRVQGDDFKAMLDEKKRLLHRTANDIIDVEVDNG